MLAAMNVTAIVLIALGGLLVMLVLAVLALRQRSKGEGPEVPHALRPGPSDVALETPVLQRLQGWGVVLVIFFVAWFPAQWLFEPGVNLTQEEEMQALALARGERAVLPFSEENQLGVGCVRCHGPELKGGLSIYVAGGYKNPPDLTTVCGGPWMGHAAITSLDDVYTTVREGRIAAGMPSWSIRFAGALPDQTINDIVLYVVSLNETNVPFNQNVCTNEDAAEAAAAGDATPPPATPSEATPAPEGGEA